MLPSPRQDAQIISGGKDLHYERITPRSGDAAVERLGLLAKVDDNPRNKSLADVVSLTLTFIQRYMLIFDRSDSNEPNELQAAGEQSIPLRY